MNAPVRPATDEQMRQAAASMHTTDIWLLLLLSDLAGGAVLFLVTWYAGWHDVATAVIAVTILGGFVATVGWLVAGLRETKLFDDWPDFDPPAQRRSAARTRRRMLVFGGFALVATAIFLLFPAAARPLSLAPALASVAVYAWAVFGERTRSRKRRHRR